MNKKILEHYISRFEKLRVDRNADWPDSSFGRSPYKPLLLLSVIDLCAQGQIDSNLIQLDLDLGQLFDIYCSIVLQDRQKSNIAMPFYHLRTDGFWHLIPLPGREAVVESGKKLRTSALLAENVLGAKLDDELYALLHIEDSRNTLRAALIEKFFIPKVRPSLVERGSINLQAFHYSKSLLDEVHKEKAVKEKAAEYGAYNEKARDQGFRRAIVTAYKHRCAFCGVRMVTIDGHTAVDAAHIKPWSGFHDDQPTNGIAMCKLCHWSFDEGLISINSRYIVISSPQLFTPGNHPGHLTTLQDRPIFKPQDDLLWPSKDSLAWHRKYKFRKF